MKVNLVGGRAKARLHHCPILIHVDRFEKESYCDDPKDGELLLKRVKP